MKVTLVFLMLIVATLAQASDKTQWTYAFYLASGEGFYREQNKNYMEIRQAADSVENGKIVVLIDVEPQKGKISALRLKKGTYAFEIQSSQAVKRLDIPTIGLFNEHQVDLDTGDPAVIKGFFDYVRTNYKSEHYFYAVVAHGDVAINPTPTAINAVTLSKALAGNKADVLALDMCYMGGLESLWDLRDAGSVLIAASTTVPLSVNNYTDFLKRAGSGKSTPSDTAADYISAYRNTYEKTRYPMSVFAIETGQRFARFASTFNQRAASFSQAPDRFDNIKATQSAKSNLHGTNTDLLSALEVVDKQLWRMLKRLIVTSFNVNTDFTGPALFLPHDRRTYEKHKAAYHATAFVGQHPNWPKFLDTLYAPE